LGSFLVDKLDFSWDEVHDIAEQLEHIKSEKLINKLMIFWVILPKIRMEILFRMQMVKLLKSKSNFRITRNQAGIAGVKDTSSEFLKYLQTRHRLGF
jgi:DtxR family Mn-dependent transcriptional regulator